MGRYEADIDLSNPNSSQLQVIDLVGAGKAVLDVGCADGSIARVLVDKGCTVSGVDIDAEAAEPARSVLEELVISDLNTERLSDHFKHGSFDAIVFADVLEHLLDPEATLRDSLDLLRPGGRIVVSIPNVGHGSVRLALLQGRWRYRPTGLLDATHIRFFTKESVLGLFEQLNMVVEVLRSTVLDPLHTEVEIDGDEILPSVIEWVRHQPNALDYQFIAAARVADSPDEVGLHPVLEPAVPYDDILVADTYTTQLEEERALRRRMLTLRDHIIGLEAALASAQEREARATARARAATRRARRERRARRRLVKATAARKQGMPSRWLRGRRGSDR